jgi:hypothetical protein
MDVFPDGGEFVCFDRGQAAAEDDGLRILSLGSMQQIAALGRGGVSDATCMNDKELRRLGDIDLSQSGVFEKLANLLAFVLIHLAAEC